MRNRSLTLASQQGAAILTALLVVTLAALLVSGLFWREQVAVRSVENRLSLAQGRWIERAAMDWARVILAEAARVEGHVGLDQTWAVPVLDTRMDETVTAGAQIEAGARSAVLAGQIQDAQARFNLTGLGEEGPVGEAWQAALRRLIELLGYPAEAAGPIIRRVQQSSDRTVDGRRLRAERPPLMGVADLLDVPGVEPALLQALSPHLVVLSEPTAVNVNTAGVEVLTAVVAGLSLTDAGRLLRAREAGSFRSLEQARLALGGSQQFDPVLLGISSSHFIVNGVIRFQGMDSQTETLLKRAGQRVEVVWQRRL